jgi:hypothetical protein
LSNKAQHATLTHAGDVFRRQYPNLVVSKRRLQQVDAIQMVRETREADSRIWVSAPVPPFSAGSRSADLHPDVFYMSAETRSSLFR